MAAVSYLLTFQSTAGRTWCILISLNCCLADISQVASGAMASAKSYSNRVWFRNVSTAGPLVASCLAYLASHDIWRRTGYTVALYGMLEWCCADGSR